MILIEDYGALHTFSCIDTFFCIRFEEFLSPFPYDNNAICFYSPMLHV